GILEVVEAQELITRRTMRLAEAEKTGAPILEDVRRRGDEALVQYARRFDQFDGHNIRVRAPEFASATARVSRDFLDAIKTAAANIREYAQLQLPRENWVTMPDGRCIGQIVRPLESMGAYIPAGRYPLPSTLLMTVIPARVAGVRNICVASPHPSTEILAAFKYCGGGYMFRMGGAQAIAAFAFGTETVPRV